MLAVLSLFLALGSSIDARTGKLFQFHPSSYHNFQTQASPLMYQMKHNHGYQTSPMKSYNYYKPDGHFAKYIGAPSKESIKLALSHAGIHIPRGMAIMITGDEMQTSHHTPSASHHTPSASHHTSSASHHKKPTYTKKPMTHERKPNCVVITLPDGTETNNCLSTPMEDVAGKEQKVCVTIENQTTGESSVVCMPGSSDGGFQTNSQITEESNSSPSVSVTPALVPAEVQADINTPVDALSLNNYFEDGSIVGAFTGKNPTASAQACAGENCVQVMNSCGSSMETNQALCLNPNLLTQANPFTENANEAFQTGVSALESQLDGRNPEKSYYWVYRIYYHVSDQETGVWMGHVQLYMAASDWTLGLYYWLDPNGDLRLVYYSATPTDGYVAEEVIWPNFVPYDWQLLKTFGAKKLSFKKF